MPDEFDEQKNNEEEDEQPDTGPSAEEEEDESDFGALTAGDSNLPPLSDFDSADSESGLPPMSGLESDTETDADQEQTEQGESATPQEEETSSSGLPPLSSLDSDFDQEDQESSGGLPPISDINVQTPDPSGRGPQHSPMEFGDESAFDTPSTEESKLDTPEPESTGFQDLAADSDFSPETPEIGPGPDSDIDTPMFSSAFGGADDSTFGDTIDTPAPAPTQAMETPMFETSESPTTGEGMGFDEGAFGDDIGGEGGTPVPDFSPDTQAPTSEEHVTKVDRGGRGGGGVGTGLLVGGIIVGILLGIAGGAALRSFVEFGFLPNPMQEQLDTANRTIQEQQGTIQRLSQRPEGQPIDPQEIERLRGEIEALNSQISQGTTELEQITAQIQNAQQNLRLVNQDIAAKNEEYIEAQEDLEELQNQLAIDRARRDGLQAENERLTELVGELEDANGRRVATKDTLEHSLNRLVVQIREGLPLTPEKFSRQNRLVAAQQLQAKVESANWVTPEVLEEYTGLYLKELAIAESNEYFFAKIPVQDNLGATYQRWAECLMNGNHNVYFRTLDGKHVGVFQDVSFGQGPPEYAFDQSIPNDLRREVNAAIRAARPDDFEEKVAVLEAKEGILRTKGPFERIFSSL